MPQIELSTTKGLVQKSGLGFVDSEFQEHDAGAEPDLAGNLQG